MSAGLVDTRWNGREKLHFLNAAPISAVGDRWISRYARDRVRALDDLKTALEQRPMSDTEFRYTTFIATTPERLWQALTDPTFTRRCRGVALESDWTAGAPMTWERAACGSPTRNGSSWRPSRTAGSRTPGTRSRRKTPLETGEALPPAA